MKRTALITGAAGGLGHPRRSRDHRQRSRARGAARQYPLPGSALVTNWLI